MTAPHIERPHIALPDPESRFTQSGPVRSIPLSRASAPPDEYQPRSVSGRPISQELISIGRVTGRRGKA